MSRCRRRRARGLDRDRARRPPARAASGDSASVARRLGHEQRRLRAGAGARAGAARRRGGRAGWRPPARRSGSRPAAATAAPRSSSSRRSARGRCSAIPRSRRRAGGARPDEVGERERAHLARRRGAATTATSPRRARSAPASSASAARRPAVEPSETMQDVGHGGAQRVPLTDVSVGTSRRKPGRAHELHRPHRRRALDVERHAVALLDRRDRRVLAAPGERPDDREAGGRSPGTCGNDEAERRRRRPSRPAAATGG